MTLYNYIKVKLGRFFYNKLKKINIKSMRVKRHDTFDSRCTAAEAIEVEQQASTEQHTK